MSSGEFVDLGHLGFSDFAREHPADALAAGMHVQHDLGRTLAIQAEKRFEHDDHEIHRREVVVEQDHLIERWTHNLRASLLDGKAGIAFGMLVGSLGHEKTIRIFQAEYNSEWRKPTPNMMPKCACASPRCRAC